MDIKIKIEAVIAGLLAVRDKYMFSVLNNTIAVSPLDNIEDNHYILFDNDGFYRGVLTDEEYKELATKFDDAVE